MTTSAAASQVQHPFMVSGPTIVKWINCCLLKVVKKTPIFLEFDPLAFVSCYTRYIDLAGVFSLDTNYLIMINHWTLTMGLLKFVFTIYDC